MNIIPKPKTLFSKLALTYIVVVFLSAYLYVKLFFFLWDEFRGAVEESTQWELATAIEQELRPLYHHALDEPALDRKLFALSRINPKIDVFLLDQSGKILFFYGHSPYIERVALEPIEQFLSQEGYPTRAIQGTSPHSNGVQNALFSVARTSIAGEPGYLYVVLEGHRYINILHAAGDFTLINVGLLYSLLAASVGSLVGVGAFYFVTKRFREMTTVVREFKEGDYSQRIPVATDDEVGEHATAFNEMADRLVENIEALETSDRLRRELVANVSHDVRAPISAIHSLLETFQMKYRSMSEEEHKEFLDRAIANSNALQSLIDDLFELSKLNAAAEAVHPRPLELYELLEDICVKFEPLSKERGVAVALETGAQLPLVIGDSKMINRALSNLVENAIRYTDAGGQVTVYATHQGDVVEVRIEDNGIGIEAQDLPHVFNRFYRAESGKRKDQRGTGLGLAIAKRIIDLHNQTLSVSSTLGEGTTFTLQLHCVSEATGAAVEV